MVVTSSITKMVTIIALLTITEVRFTEATTLYVWRHSMMVSMLPWKRSILPWNWDKVSLTTALSDSKSTMSLDLLVLVKYW